VRRIWAFYRDGVRVEALLKRFPKLGPAQIFDALAFALDNPEVVQADIERERELLSAAGVKTADKKPSSQIALPFDFGDDD